MPSWPFDEAEPAPSDEVEPLVKHVRHQFELFVCTHDLLASGLDENVYANRLQLVTAGDRGTAGVAPNART
jgi:hypothetical protein